MSNDVNLIEYIKKLNILRSEIPNNDIYLENLETNTTVYDKKFIKIFDENIKKVIDYENKLKERIQINKEKELKEAEEKNRLLEEGEKKETIRKIIENNVEILKILKEKPKLKEKIEAIKQKKYNDMPKIDEIEKLDDLTVLKSFYDITKEYLASIKEQLGKIRTYLKVRDGSKSVGGSDNDYAKIIEPNQIEINCVSTKEEKTTYGPFYKLLNNTTNKETFEQLKENFVWDNIKGQTLILFAYGVTGSGKTTTFFSDDGLIHSIYKHFNNNEYTISVDDIIENRLNYNSEFIKLKKSNSLDAEFDTNELVGEINKNDFKDLIKEKKDIKEILSGIQEIRKKNATIKATPYNEESSRSHLFISLKIKKKETDEDSYIVLCDSAGRETPSELIIRYYKNEKDLWINPSRAFYTNGYIKNNAFMKLILKDVKEKLYISKDILDKKITSKYGNNYHEIFTKIMEKDSKLKDKDLTEEKKVFIEIQTYLKNVIKESYFICETLNVISKILDNEINLDYIESNDIEKYDTEKSKVNTVKLITPYDKDQTKIKKIFNDIIEKTDGKYKFIMLTTLDVEKTKLSNYIKCNEAKNTLAFTNLIKST